MKAAQSPDIEESLYAGVHDLIVSSRQTIARGVDLVKVRNHDGAGP